LVAARPPADKGNSGTAMDVSIQDQSNNGVLGSLQIEHFLSILPDQALLQRLHAGFD
jgi:hypothetical protein